MNKLRYTVYTTRQMTARELRSLLKQFGCVEVRQKGSHLRVECGTCVTTIPVHKGEDIRPGTLRQIEPRPCAVSRKELAKKWPLNI